MKKKLVLLAAVLLLFTVMGSAAHLTDKDSMENGSTKLGFENEAGNSMDNTGAMFGTWSLKTTSGNVLKSYTQNLSTNNITIYGSMKVDSMPASNDGFRHDIYGNQGSTAGDQIGQLILGDSGFLQWYNGSRTNIQAASANTIYNYSMKLDFNNDKAHITVNGVYRGAYLFRDTTATAASGLRMGYDDSAGVGFTGWSDEITYGAVLPDNAAPTFNSTAFSPSDPNKGDSISAFANASDGNGDNLDAWVKAEYANGTVIAGTQTMSEPTANEFEATNLFTANAVTTYNITYTVGDGTTNTTQEDTFTITDTAPTVSINDPQAQNYSAVPPYQVNLNDTDDVTGETYTWAVWLNGAQVDSGSGTENVSVSGWLNNSVQGSNTFTANATDDAGNVGTNSVTYTYDTEAPALEIQEPTGNFTRKTSLPLNYTVSDNVSTTDTCWYNVDGGSNNTLASCSNTTFSVSTIGDHTLNLYANDTAGNVNNTASTFTTDHLNEIRLTNADTGSSINSFTVTYDNGTDTFSTSTTSGNALFNTSDLPTGKNTVTLQDAGYDTKTVNQTVDPSYEINQSFNMEPTAFSFQVFDEQTQNKIGYNITISDGSTSKEVASQLRNDTTLYASGPAKQKMGTYEFKKAVPVDELTFRTGSVAYCNSFEYRLNLLNGTNITESTGSCASNTEYDLTFSNTELVKSADVYVTLAAGGGNAKITWTVFRDNDLGGFSETYNGLNASGFPLGDLTITVDNSDYKPRTYFLSLTSTSTASLDAYLLKETEGVYASVKVLDKNMKTIQGATVTNQLQFGNTYQTIGQKKTSTTGEATFFLDPDRTYKVLVTHPSYVSFEGTWNPANYQYNPLQIQLGDSSQFGFSTPWDGISVKIKPDQQTLPANRTNLTGTISDSDNSLSNFKLEVRNSTGSLLNSSTVSGSPSGGSIELYANLSGYSQGSTINATLYFTKNGTSYSYTRNYKVISPLEEGDYSLFKFMRDFRDTAGPLVTGFIALLITLMVGTWVSNTNFIGREGGGIVVLLTLGFFVIPNWIDAFMWIITALTLMGMYTMRR